MKHLYLITVFVVILASTAMGQVGINTGNNQPDPSAMLDVSATNKGFLPPRLTQAQRASIPSPVAGLIIWCNNCGMSGELQVYNGTSWTNMTGGPATSFVIGQSYGGGIIFYIDGTGQHGLIAANTDQSGGADWGCYITLIGTNTAIGTGSQNTTSILAGCADLGIAARVCRAYNGGGHNDWFLPSKDELNLMYIQRTVVGGFTNDGFYWSSSEDNFLFVWYQYFLNGMQSIADKLMVYRVRAVRAF